MRLIQIFTMTFIVLILSNCSGGKSSNKSTISQNGKVIPICSKDKRDSSKTIKIKEGDVVKSLEDNTKFRLYHYSNDEKLICVSKGKAVVIENKK